MKTTSKMILAGMLLCVSVQNASSKSGIYMSENDYKNNKLTYENNCHKEKTKIRLHGFFYNASTVTVKQEGKKYTLKKDDLYGFRDCNNDVYRFYKNTPYKIAEAGGIYIYTQTRNETQVKGYKVVNVYYFSTTPSGNIQPLTLGNLKNVYRNNDRFLDLLDIYFGNGEVNEYDQIHKTYKINYVYNKISKQ